MNEVLMGRKSCFLYTAKNESVYVLSTPLYIGSTHIDDTINNFLSSHTLSTYLRFLFL
jgi:hypothetical protein